jgi:hypothetical protein
VLSVGAITANLMELRLAYPKMIAQAHPLSARVIAVNPVTGKALPGVNLKATLSDDEDKSKKKAFTRVATTGRNGEAILTFLPLGEPGDSLDLTVEGTLTGEGGALVRDSVNGDTEVWTGKHACGDGQAAAQAGRDRPSSRAGLQKR